MKHIGANSTPFSREKYLTWPYLSELQALALIWIPTRGLPFGPPPENIRRQNNAI